MLSSCSQAPRFTLRDLDGAEHSLDALLARGPVLLAIFKISCPVCQLTLPYLNRLAGGGLQTVAISQDDAAPTKRFHGRFGISLPTLIDREEDGYPVSNAFGVTHVPSLLLVEPDGRISLSSEGFVKADLETAAARASKPIFQAGESVPAWKAG